MNHYLLILPEKRADVAPLSPAEMEEMIGRCKA